MIEVIKTTYAYNTPEWMLFLNDKSFGEIVSFEFNSLDTEKELKITIQLMKGADKLDEYLRDLKDASVKEIFASKEGKSLVREYRKVTFKGIQAVRDLDFDVITDTYIFSCEEITGLKEIGGDDNE